MRGDGFHKGSKKRQAFLAAYARWGTITAACEKAKVSWPTVNKYRKSDPDFVRQLEEADETFTDLLEAVDHSKALKGIEPSLGRQLKARKPHKYRDPVQRIASTDAEGNDKPELTDEERAARTLALLDRARARRDGQPDSSEGDVGAAGGASD